MIHGALVLFGAWSAAQASPAASTWTHALAFTRLAANPVARPAAHFIDTLPAQESPAVPAQETGASSQAPAPAPAPAGEADAGLQDETVGVQDAEPAARAAQPVPSAPPRASAARTFAELEQAWQDLTSAEAWLCSLTSLGRSAGGRDVWWFTLGARDGDGARSGDPDRRPALLVYADERAARADDLRAARELLELCAALVARAKQDAALAELLARTTLYCLPALDPDALGAPPAAQPAPRARLERDFPVGWSAWSEPLEELGTHPLSRDESRALARTLQQRVNLALVLVTAADAPATAPDSPPASPDDRVLGLQRLPAPPGSLAAFLAGCARVDAVRADPAATTDAELERLLRSLPQLSGAEPLVERLRANLWMVDVALENRGALGTADGAQASAASPSVWFQTSGGRTVAAALRRGDAGGFEALMLRPTRSFLADLAPGERGMLRLMIEAPEKAALELVLDSRRAGGRNLPIFLP